MGYAVMGFALGFIAAWIAVARRKHRGASMVALRAAGALAASPYRGTTATPEPPFADVVAALRAAHLGVRERGAGVVEVHDGDHHVRIAAADPARAALADLELRDTGHETLAFAVALALVPLYGPLQLTEALWGTFVVDGRRDRDALREERGERIKALARMIQERLQRTQPMWEEIGRRLS